MSDERFMAPPPIFSATNKTNAAQRKAQAADDDEFYTRREDIEAELSHYEDLLRDKIIYCPCDTPGRSHFWEYFHQNFTRFGLKGLICTYYDDPSKILGHAVDSYALYYTREYKEEKLKGVRDKELKSLQMDNDVFKGYGKPLTNDTAHGYPAGDFRSIDCQAIMNTADIVITNPPFSLFNEFFAILMAHNKKFLTIANKAAPALVNVFPYFKENKCYVGYTIPKDFERPVVSEDGCTIDHTVLSGKMSGLTIWITNLKCPRLYAPKHLSWSYMKNKQHYPKYENYDAIDVTKVPQIPYDYNGVMGVPVSFLHEWCPAQFEILGQADRGNKWGLTTHKYTKSETPKYNDLNRGAVIKLENGEYKALSSRVFIRRCATESNYHITDDSISTVLRPFMSDFDNMRVFCPWQDGADDINFWMQSISPEERSWKSITFTCANWAWQHPCTFALDAKLNVIYGSNFTAPIPIESEISEQLKNTDMLYTILTTVEQVRTLKKLMSDIQFHSFGNKHWSLLLLAYSDDVKSEISTQFGDSLQNKNTCLTKLNETIFDDSKSVFLGHDFSNIELVAFEGEF